MDEPTPLPPSVMILVLQSLVLVPALAIAFSQALRARAIVGPVLARERPFRALRIALLGGPLLVAFAFVALTGAIPIAFTSLLLALAFALVWLVPGLQDATCGATGVRRGFHARTYEELEEWRLTGEHLRFRLFGEWTSVPCPLELQPALRERLLAACPERESPFR